MNEFFCPICEDMIYHPDKIVCPLKHGPFNPSHIDSTKGPIVCVLGCPGSGKTTQCRKIMAKYNFAYLSPETAIKSAVVSNKAPSKWLKNVVKRGEAIPPAIVVQALYEAMTKVTSAVNGFVSDGFPGAIVLAQYFERVAKSPISAIIYLEVSMQVATDRLRHSVTPRQTEEYAADMATRMPLIKSGHEVIMTGYPKIVRRVNGEKSSDQVFNDVVRILNPMVIKAALMGANKSVKMYMLRCLLFGYPQD